MNFTSNFPSNVRDQVRHVFTGETDDRDSQDTEGGTDTSNHDERPLPPRDPSGGGTREFRRVGVGFDSVVGVVLCHRDCSVSSSPLRSNGSPGTFHCVRPVVVGSLGRVRHPGNYHASQAYRCPLTCNRLVSLTPETRGVDTPWNEYRRRVTSERLNVP